MAIHRSSFFFAQEFAKLIKNLQHALGTVGNDCVRGVWRFEMSRAGTRLVNAVKSYSCSQVIMTAGLADEDSKFTHVFGSFLERTVIF